MSEKAAQVQNYNQDLVTYIEDIKRKKHKVQQELDKDYKERLELEDQITLLREKTSQIDSKIAKRQKKILRITDVLEHSEVAYSKVVESLRVLVDYASTESQKQNKSTDE